MPYELEFTKLFVAQFGKLEKTAQRRIYKKIQELKEDPYRHKALTYPFRGCFRLRVGNFRVVYMPAERMKKVVLIDVNLREKIYKKDISKIIDEISGRTPFQK
jgi:mRNA-degrading endonuclease RelE of RelBE toxin-antitoxin system